MQVQTCRRTFHQELTRQRAYQVAQRIHDLDGNVDLGKAVWTSNEVAIGVDLELRHVQDIEVIQLQAKHLGRLGLTSAQFAMPPFTPLSKLPGVHGAESPPSPFVIDVNRYGVQFVLAQEDLVRGVGGIGLVLVDKGSGGVLRLSAVFAERRDPRQGHETQCAGRSSVVPKIWSAPAISGSSGCNGM